MWESNPVILTVSVKAAVDLKRFIMIIEPKHFCTGRTTSSIFTASATTSEIDWCIFKLVDC